MAKRPKPKRRKQRPVQWAYEDGQSIVVRSTGDHVWQLPLARLCNLHDTIAGMDTVVRAFDSVRDIKDPARRDLLMSLCASQARHLMVACDHTMADVVALAPWLRDALHRRAARQCRVDSQ